MKKGKNSIIPWSWYDWKAIAVGYNMTAVQIQGMIKKILFHSCGTNIAGYKSKVEAVQTQRTNKRVVFHGRGTI